MPTYDYKCSNCGNEFEEFQRMSDPVLTTCPECKESTLERKIGSGAGLLFKGNGFYITDYKKNTPDKAYKKDEPPKTESKKTAEKKESAPKD